MLWVMLVDRTDTVNHADTADRTNTVDRTSNVKNMALALAQMPWHLNALIT
jgi:hypothetical protein